jgi:hypothetical protein
MKMFFKNRTPQYKRVLGSLLRKVGDYFWNEKRLSQKLLVNKLLSYFKFINSYFLAFYKT